VHDFSDDGFERFERAQARLRSHPGAPASIVARWSTIQPNSPADARRFAVSIESLLLSLLE
jgi:hypothetical protein